MSKGKSVAKSIRMTDEIYAYICGYRGDGFNEKLENIVLDCITGEADRLRRFEELEDQIKDLQASKNTLLESYRRLQQFFREIDSLAWYGRNLFDTFERMKAAGDVPPRG